MKLPSVSPERFDRLSGGETALRPYIIRYENIYSQILRPPTAAQKPVRGDSYRSEVPPRREDESPNVRRGSQLNELLGIVGLYSPRKV